MQIVLLFTSLFSMASASMPLAILHVEGPAGSADLCAIYNPHYSAIPMTLQRTPRYKVFQPDPPDGCEDYVAINAANSSSFVIPSDNCIPFEKFKHAYHAAKQVIVISDTSSATDFPVGKAYEHKQVHIPVGMIAKRSWSTVKNKLGSPMYAQLYHPHDPLFDPNLIVIWLIAVFTVVVGSYWCGLILQRSLDESDYTKKDEDEEGNDFPITTVMVFIFIFMICTVLLLLYFFYKYLIFVVIGLFAIAATSGTYECMSGLLSLLKCGQCRVPENNLPILKHQPEIRNIILFFCCLALSIYWIVVRNTPYSWILQDFLGVCFCISLLKVIRLPNFKISMILLLALLVYDIFFVFITPFFSAQGKSVMVEVATGKGGNEQLPMVIRVPKIIKTALSLCERPYSILGFGDILLPGLFVAFCHNFDVIAKTKHKVYFIATSIAYGLGLCATFVALMAMKVGQPALLYLAPSVLLAATLVGCIRGEFKALWYGRVIEYKHADTDVMHSEDSNETEKLLDHSRTP